ncbi:hypothetical protein HKBW3S42_01359, partial [Candidatus Hakubella thermalkaliphila]
MYKEKTMMFLSTETLLPASAGTKSGKA